MTELPHVQSGLSADEDPRIGGKSLRKVKIVPRVSLTVLVLFRVLI